MSHVNQVILIANLGKDPEVLKTTDQGNFVRLSLATNKRYKDKNGEKQTDTQWHVVYLSDRLGKIGSSYLKKGDKVFISGELRNREWFDDNGIRHYHTSVYAKEIKFLNSKEEKTNQANPPQKENTYSKARQEIRHALGESLPITT